MSDTQFTEQELRDLRMIFNVYDPTNSGVIEIPDLKKGLRVLGFKVSRKQLLKILVDASSRGQRTVDFQGLLHVIDHLQGQDYDTHEELTQAFSFMDKDGDTLLSQEDLQRVSREVGLRLSAEEIRGMIEEADKDGDGKVSLKEFMDTMRKTVLFQ